MRLTVLQADNHAFHVGVHIYVIPYLEMLLMIGFLASDVAEVRIYLNYAIPHIIANTFSSRLCFPFIPSSLALGGMTMIPRSLGSMTMIPV